MVTIEQKLLLFSKLLNQSMDNKFSEEIKEMDKEYENLLKKNKEEVDKEAFEIEDKAKKQAEMKNIESISKTKVLVKKEIMAVKEKYFKIFMNNFKEKLREFTKTDKFKLYLEKNINKLNIELKNFNKEYNDLTISITAADYEKYNDFIKQKIIKEIIGKNIEFKTVNDIIGGLILEIPEHNLRYDMTIDAVLEENETAIMQILFESLEAGDYIGS